MRSKSVISAALLSALLVAGCSSSSSSQVSSPTVRVLFQPNAELLPMFVANDAGLFKQQGLNVTLQETDPTAIVPAVTARSADLGMTTAPALLLGDQNGLDLVVAAGGSVNTPDDPRVFLVAGKGSGITRPEQLAGKRIALPGRGSFAEFGADILLRRAGVDPASIQWVEMGFPDMNDALNAHRVDAAIAVVPFTILMQASGHTLLLDYSSLSKSLPIAFLFARRDWAQANRQAILLFRAALEAAIKRINTDPDFARQVEAKYTGMPSDIVAKTPFSTFRADMTPEELQTWIDILVQVGAIKPGLKAADLIIPLPQ